MDPYKNPIDVLKDPCIPPFKGTLKGTLIRSRKETLLRFLKGTLIRSLTGTLKGRPKPQEVAELYAFRCAFAVSRGDDAASFRA